MRVGVDRFNGEEDFVLVAVVVDDGFDDDDNFMKEEGLKY